MIPSDLPHGIYVLALAHYSLRGGNEALVPTLEQFRAAFTIGDETSKEEVEGLQVWG